MPVSRKSRQSRRSTDPAVSGERKSRRVEIVVVDNAPLQREAWAEFHTAKKRLEKVSRDLHRHEEIDAPAYDAWLHRVFPVQITDLRTLQEEVFAKGKKVEMVQALGYLTGRSLKKLWRELKEQENDPEHPDEDEVTSDEKEKGFDESGEESSKKTRRQQRQGRSTDADEGSYARSEYERDSRGTRFASAERPAGQATGDAKAIYRRLVQQLHPDRGGEWTPSRQRLWHDIQEAWAKGDVDWLARLEVEWETANDQLGPTSPVSRLRKAIEELHGARRDLERKLRDYRVAESWRFTAREKDRAELRRRLHANFQHDLAYLRSQLRYLDATIAAWERTSGTRRYVGE